MKNTKALFLAAITALNSMLAYGQGTITFANSGLTRMMISENGVTTTVPVSFAIHYGVFVNGSPTPVSPLGVNSTNTAGIISGVPPVYPLPGTSEGEVVSLQVRGWSASFGTNWQAARTAGAWYDETDVRQVTLGSPSGPSIPIWQASTGTNPNRFHPLILTNGSLRINDIIVAEGSNGVVAAVFTVSLAGTQEQTVTVDYYTQDGSALAGQDYVATNGTVTFNPGEISQTITVTITADTPPESDETFSVILTNFVNTTLGKGTGTCLISEARITEIRIDTAVTFHTVAGRHYVLEQSTDLATWTAVEGAADVTGVGGPMTIYDRGVGCAGGRYYRTRLLTP